MDLTVGPYVITCAICYGIFYIAMWHFRRRRLYEMAAKFDGPPPLPFIGNAHLIIGSGEHLLNKFDALNKLYPSPFRFWIGPHLALFISDPEQVKTISLSPKTLGKGHVLQDFTRPLFGTGLVIAPVTEWKANRKLIQPTFNMRNLNSFVQIFATQSMILTKLLEQYLNGPEFEIFNLIFLCALDMICETAIGVKVEGQKSQNISFVEAVEESVAGQSKRFFHPWLHPNIIFNLTQVGRDQKKHIKYLRDFTDNVIKMRKKELSESRNRPSEADREDDACESKFRREVFLDHLLKYGNDNYSDQGFQDEVLTMILAGNDTTAITSSFVILMLASHPEVQDKVYEELYEIYGNSEIEDCPVTSEDLPRMKYMERVIKETLRLFPITAFTVREVSDDLKIGDNIFPTGSFVIIETLELHRSEKYWPDPLNFDPDRFLPEEVAKRHPYAYMAFSAGPRNCLGNNFAMMAMKTLFATILRKYIFKMDKILPIKEIRLRADIFLHPVDTIKIRIERQTKN